MVEIYQSEQEQVEALKRWWDENGRSVIAGVVIAVVLVGGWKGWSVYRTNQAEAASAAYAQVVSAVEAGMADRAREQGRILVDEYGSTPYAPLGSLYLSKLAVESGDLDAAASHLRWVMANASMPEVVEVATVRLARVLAQQGEHDEALALVGGKTPAGFEGVYAEVRGDIQLARGKRAEARVAYLEAMGAYVNSPQKRSLVQMKLDDLAGAGAGNGKP